MKKFLFLIFLLIPIMLLGQKNPYDSFERFESIGYVYPLSGYQAEYALYWDYISATGYQTYTIIDTTYLDDATYDGENNWSSLSLVIIAHGSYGDGTTASPDTSLADGIGDVNVICMEPAFWEDFGMPDSAGYVVNDSVAVLDNSFFLDSLWAVNDTLLMFESAEDTIYTIEGTGIDSTQGYVGTIDLADTVVYYKDFGGYKRVAWGPRIPTYLGTKGDQEGMTLFNRVMAYLYGTSTDSLFDVVQIENWDFTGGQGIYLSRYTKSLLEQNGHTVDSCNVSDVDDQGSSYFEAYDLIVVDHTTLGPITTADVETLRASGTPILCMGAPWTTTGQVDSFSYGTGNATTPYGSVKLVGGRHQALSNYAVDSIISMDGGPPNADAVTGLNGGYYGLGVNSDTTTHYTIVVDRDYKEVFFGYDQRGDTDALTDAGFDLLFDLLGWLMDNEPFQVDSLTYTAMSEDCLKVSWSVYDTNASTTLSIRRYEPGVDTTWYVTGLGETIIADTMFAFNPNTEVIYDVFTILGTDTLASLCGVDSGYTLCHQLPSPFTEALSDTSVTFTLNGFWFYDWFRDSSLTATNAWSVGDGGFSIVSRYWQLQADSGNGTGTADTNVISVAYDCDGTWGQDEMNHNAIYHTYFKFDDSLGVFDTNFLEFYVMADSLDQIPYAPDDYPDGYWVRINPHYQDTKGYVYLIRYKEGTSAAIETLAVDSSWADPTATYPPSFKWNELEVVRQWYIDPEDTTVRWSVVLNDDSLFHYTEDDPDSMVVAQDGIILKTNCWVDFDDIYIRQLTPGGNHDSTHYAFQDSASGDYVDWNANPDTIKSSTEVWGTYVEWNSLLDTLSQLDAFTTYNLRTKARNGRE